MPASTDIFALRCSQAARGVADGKLGLIEAVDRLQLLAAKTGVVDRLGQDHVQRLMSTCFKSIRRAP
jgi:hypothetical protein